MKNNINLLLATLLVVVSFSFISCEFEKEEPKAKYTYVGDIFDPFDLTEFPDGNIATVIVNDNSLLIKKKNWIVPSATTNWKPKIVSLDVEVSNDTIYIYENWGNVVVCNCIHMRDENIFVTNMPKGKWIVNNILTVNSGEEHYNFTIPFNFCTFSIEIE
jgi:hypothetical protein